MDDTILRLQSGWSVRPAGEGQWELISYSQGRRLRLGSRRAGLGPALERLTAGVAANDAEGELGRAGGLPPEMSRRLLGDLERNGALVRRAPDDDVSALDGTSLYDRQIRFLSFFETDESSGGTLNRRLQDRTVVIPGLGGLGGWIALLCARMGIRNIVGIDPDEVELSNLHRQVLYTREDLGRPKVDACARRLREADPDVRFTGHARWLRTPADLRPLLEGADLVINGFPHFLPSFAEAAAAVSTAALEARVPVLQLPIAQCVGPLTIPGVTACHRCAHGVLAERIGDSARGTPPWAREGFLGALAPRQAVSAGLAVWEATRFLSGMDRPPTLDGVLWIDLATYTGHGFTPTPRLEECPACGGGSS
jgi:hypothetical protein